MGYLLSLHSCAISFFDAGSLVKACVLGITENMKSNIPCCSPPLGCITKDIIFLFLYRAQPDIYLVALKSFSTPFCENCYQNLAVLAERCCFYCENPLLFCGIRVKIGKISVLHKVFTAFAYSIRAPPSEV